VFISQKVHPKIYFCSLLFFSPIKTLFIPKTEKLTKTKNKNKSQTKPNQNKTKNKSNQGRKKIKEY